MTSRDFCYWLQGYFELAGCNALSQEQVKTIQNHLGMVFVHEIDPTFGGPAKQDILNTIHSGKIPNQVVMKC